MDLETFSRRYRLGRKMSPTWSTFSVRLLTRSFRDNGRPMLLQADRHQTVSLTKLYVFDFLMRTRTLTKTIRISICHGFDLTVS